MSIVSKLTGIGISRKGVHIDPMKAAMTALTVGTLGAGGGVGALAKLGKLGALKKVGGALLGGGGQSDTDQMLGMGGGGHGDRFRNILDLGKAGEGIYDRYQENKQYGDARHAWDEAAPLRDAGMKGLLDESRPDVSNVFADPMNPQGRYRRVSVGSRGAY